LNELNALALIAEAPRMIEFPPAVVPAFVNIFRQATAPFVRAAKRAASSVDSNQLWGDRLNSISHN
jgi:hypothetical protein